MTERYNCPYCQDCGLVSCWNVEAMAGARHAVREGGEPSQDAIPDRDVGVACSCSAGNGRAEFLSRRKITASRYDPDVWVRRTGDTADDWAALITWAENYQLPNRVDFGEYSRA